MRIRPLLTVLLLTSAWLVAAAPSYVIDKLLVGVHEQKNLDSAIIKVLPTGTRLEVIERDGELALVEDAGKVRGWVDAAYLTEDAPAALRVASLEKENRALNKQLDSLRKSAANSAPAATGSSADSAAEVNALTNENTELKGKLSNELLRAGKMQSELATLRAKVENHSAPPDARVVELEREREKLAEDLEEAKSAIDELSARASLKATSAMVPLVLKAYFTPIALGGLLLLALAFGAGIYVVDVLNRRRHGGFRV